MRERLKRKRARERQREREADIYIERETERERRERKERTSDSGERKRERTCLVIGDMVCLLQRNKPDIQYSYHHHFTAVLKVTLIKIQFNYIQHSDLKVYTIIKMTPVTVKYWC